MDSFDADSKPASVAYLRLTTGCNARCRMCDFWNSPVKELSAGDLQLVLQALADQGYAEVIFTGGEPSQADLLAAALEQAVQRGLRTSLITNGTGVSSWTSRNSDIRDLNRCFLSVDSPLAETHDQIRGVACLKKIEQWLEMRDCNLQIVINTVVSRLNLPDLALLPDWMCRYGLPSLNLIMMKHPVFALPAQQAWAAGEDLLRRCQERGIRHYVTARPEGVDCGLARECLLASWPKCCALGSACLFVDHAGRTFPCNCTPYLGESASSGNLLNSAGRRPVDRPQSGRADYWQSRQFPACPAICDLSNRIFNFINSDGVRHEGNL